MDEIDSPVANLYGMVGSAYSAFLEKRVLVFKCMRRLYDRCNIISSSSDL